MSRTFNVSVVGAGVVSHAYLGSIRRSPELRLRYVCSKSGSSARRQTAIWGGTAATLAEILADAQTDIIVNLAPPDTHYEIGTAALRAGKHLYSEKPFATSLAGAQELVAMAADKGLKIGCAPDTFLGPAHQAARRALDSGVIGQVIGGAVAVQSRGMEAWHPNPAAFYQVGGGPLLDVGPYYVTILVHLLGPVVEVCGFSTRPASTRSYVDAKGQPASLDVSVPTTFNGALMFECGANVGISASWDVWNHRRSPIELYGEKGALAAADPNYFAGGVEISLAGAEWTPYQGNAPQPKKAFDADIVRKALQLISAGIDPLSGKPLGSTNEPLLGDLRGLGITDLAASIREERAPRASGELALHVLDVLLALETASHERRTIAIRSTAARPPPAT